VLVKVQVRNQKGKGVLDFKGIPVEQVAKLGEALTAELPPGARGAAGGEGGSPGVSPGA